MAVQTSSTPPVTWYVRMRPNQTRAERKEVETMRRARERVKMREMPSSRMPRQYKQNMSHKLRGRPVYVEQNGDARGENLER